MSKPDVAKVLRYTIVTNIVNVSIPVAFVTVLSSMVFSLVFFCCDLISCGVPSTEYRRSPGIAFSSQAAHFDTPPVTRSDVPVPTGVYALPAGEQYHVAGVMPSLLNKDTLPVLLFLPTFVSHAAYCSRLLGTWKLL